MGFRKLLKARSTWFQSIYPRLNRFSGGSLDLLRSAVQSYNKSRAGEAAASIAYYSFFSLFPLLIFIVTGASFVLERKFFLDRLMASLQTIIPVSQSVITNNIDRVLSERSTFGLVALIGLLWSATGVFSTLALNINRAWSEAQVRSFLQSRLIALAMVGILVAMLFLSLVATAGMEMLSHLRLPIGGTVQVYESPLWTIFSDLALFSIRLVMFWAMYLWIPNIRVPWRAALTGALATALLWELITRLFTWYLSSGFARYEMIYGSLGTIVALLFWIYLASSTVLFGAHLTACQSKKNPSPQAN